MKVHCIESPLLTEAGFPVHGFTTRQGGVSPEPYASLNLAYDLGDSDANVTENLARLAATVGGGRPLARARQTHGNTVVTDAEARLDAWTDRPLVEADAIIGQGEATVAVQTADCAPVLIACPDTRVVAAVHAGWRGAANGLIRKTLRQMREMGCSPSRLRVAIGPTIGYPCYEVGDEVARALPESADPAPGRPGKHLLDLANAVEVSLIVEGVTSDNIERVGGCPHCDTAAFFSHRASQGGPTGRMMAFVSSAQS